MPKKSRECPEKKRHNYDQDTDDEYPCAVIKFKSAWFSFHSTLHHWTRRAAMLLSKKDEEYIVASSVSPKGTTIFKVAYLVAIGS
jgi:hypothetical protein